MIHPTLRDLQNEATWLERRSLMVAPLRVTELVTTEESRAEFLEGARLLRLDKRRRYDGEIIGPTPVQLAIADMLNAGHKLNAVHEPRRATKTTSLQAVLLGRCALREDYLVGWTLATTGAKAGERFKKDISAHIVRLYPSKEDRAAQGIKLELSKGSEGLVFTNGSYFNVYAPNAEGFTSNAFDAAWVDEAGKATPALGDDLTTAIRPTLHTRAGAQFILSGTSADYRSGNLLHDALSDPKAGVIQHGIPDDTDPEELRAWEATDDAPRGRVRELVELSHPGIGWSTPLEAIEDDWNSPPMRKGFPAEILGLFGAEGSNTALLNQPKWTAAALSLPEAGVAPPEVFALSAFVHPDAAWASVAAAWAGADGRVHVCLLHHQEGVQGFPLRLLELSRKHNRPVTYDSKSDATEVVMRQIREARPAPVERPLLSRDISRGAVHFTNLLNEDKLRHYDQTPMNSAAEIAVKRAFGQGGGWAFGRPDTRNRPGDDITPIEAASIAAFVLDQQTRISTEVSIDFFA